MIRIILGSLLLFGVIALFGALSVHQIGWRATAVIWTATLSLTAIVVAAVWLITGTL